MMINQKLEDLTSNILLQNDMYKIPVDVVNLAQLLDIKVYSADLPKEISGAIKYNKETKDFSILVNKNDAPVRIRFTIAHELGHFFLHKEILKSDEVHVDILYRMPQGGEKDVDYFAGALLMNKMLLQTMYEEHPSIKELAIIFKVSESAMTVRLNVLGLL